MRRPVSRRSRSSVCLSAMSSDLQTTPIDAVTKTARSSMLGALRSRQCAGAEPMLLKYAASASGSIAPPARSSSVGFAPLPSTPTPRAARSFSASGAVLTPSSSSLSACSCRSQRRRFKSLEKRLRATKPRQVRWMLQHARTTSRRRFWRTRERSAGSTLRNQRCSRSTPCEAPLCRATLSAARGCTGLVRPERSSAFRACLSLSSFRSHNSLPSHARSRYPRQTALSRLAARQRRSNRRARSPRNAR
mmetsp:Transcript_45853/g.141235  ORF Transcript_45853/g.141235 Transcript_45853/m.141235 type:complete len:248 (-) Transcript_45853:214-957(-)